MTQPISGLITGGPDTCPTNHAPTTALSPLRILRRTPDRVQTRPQRQLTDSGYDRSNPARPHTRGRPVSDGRSERTHNPSRQYPDSLCSTSRCSILSPRLVLPFPERERTVGPTSRARSFPLSPVRHADPLRHPTRISLCFLARYPLSIYSSIDQLVIPQTRIL